MNTNPNLRPTKRTPISILAAAQAILEFIPSPDAAAKLLAQSILETGNFRYCWNWNWGNKKRNPANGPYFMIRCSEIINGKEIFFDPPHIQTCFAAYESISQGCHDWILLITSSKRYQQASWLLHNPNKSAYDFAYCLGELGYYTANRTRYSNGVQNLYNKALIAVGNANSPNPPEELTKAEISIEEIIRINNDIQ